MRVGYGKSTVSKQAEDYSMKNINRSMKALLDHLGKDRAVWIGKSRYICTLKGVNSRLLQDTIGALELYGPSQLITQISVWL